MSAGFRIGAHTPTAGGLQKALSSGARIGCDTIQLFTASPRQWAHPPMDAAKVRAFRRMNDATGLYPLVAHDSYLINLAAPDDELVEKSRQAFLREMQRAEALGLDYLVTHLGAHTGSGVEAGLARLAQSLNWLHQQTENFRVRVALETTAGQGTTLGGSFDHFPALFAQVADADRLMVCLDTCHIFVAGYDFRDVVRATKVWDDFDTKVGLQRLACIHANDALKGLGSKADRHAHIGSGHIGVAGFQALLGDSRLQEKVPQPLPIIVETPEAEEMHERNVWMLRQIVAGKVGPSAADEAYSVIPSDAQIPLFMV